MPDVDEFDDFEDVVLEDYPLQVLMEGDSYLQEFSLNTDSLLKAPTNLIDEQSRLLSFVWIDVIDDENIMKTEIQDLIDQTDNKEVVIDQRSLCIDY